MKKNQETKKTEKEVKGKAKKQSKAQNPKSAKKQGAKQGKEFKKEQKFRQNKFKNLKAKPQKQKPETKKNEKIKTDKTKKTKKQSNALIKIRFLGGVGEIGKNMTAFECGDDIVIVDAGLSFPTERMPGVDLLLPDISYLTKNAKKVRGLILTHGHEDHIGGVPFLLKELNVPVFGTRLTLALIQNKLDEHKITEANFNVIEAGSNLKLGCFNIEFINVNHSISGAVALSVKAEGLSIFHSGDFKVDFTPVKGDVIDLTRIGEIGEEGVDLLLAESTNIEEEGFTVSETSVGQTLDRVFSANAKRRLIISMFASNVHRMQQIVDLAVKYGRKIALMGKSMVRVVESAESIGELVIPENTVIDIESAKRFKPENLVVLCTGTQGEPLSALTRMANGESKVEIGKKDTVVISASVIPGNEKFIYGVIDNLYRKGAEVIYRSIESIHVSGHACKEELRLLHTLVKPKYFVPVHGEYRHLKKHERLAMELGMREGQIFVAEIGNTIELSSDGVKFGEQFSAGVNLVDGSGIESADSAFLKERQIISQDGLVNVAVAFNEYNEILSVKIEPIGIKIEEPLVVECEKNVRNSLKNVELKREDGVTEAKTLIIKSIKNMLIKKTGKKPYIVPMVMVL